MLELFVDEWTSGHNAVLQNSVWFSVMLIGGCALLWRVTHDWRGNFHDTLFALSLAAICFSAAAGSGWWVAAVLLNPDPEKFIRHPWFDENRWWLDIPTGFVVLASGVAGVALGYVRETSCAVCYGVALLLVVSAFAVGMLQLTPT